MAGAGTALRLGLVLGAAGAIFATPVLILPGAALVLLVAGCAAWVQLSVRAVTVRRSGVPARVTEGEPFTIVVDGVSGRLPLLARIEDDAAAAPGTLLVMRPRSPFTVRLEGSFARRGHHHLAAPVLRAADPLGIAAATVPAGPPGSILVVPRIEPLTAPSGGGGAVGRRRGLGELAAGGERESSADPEVDGVRPYRPGTKATRIYWPALARGAGLVERRIVAAGDTAPLIALDPTGAVREEDLDSAVRAAASLMAHLVRLGGCELLIGGAGRRLAAGRDPRGWTSALAALALVGGGDGAPRLSSADLRANVFWIAASIEPRPPSGISRGFVVGPRARSGVATAFSVAGCSGYALTHGALARRAA